MRPLLAALFLLPVVACDKEDGIGKGVLPPELLLGVHRIDTLTIETRTVPDDSIRADGLDAVLLGNHHDPKFGRLVSGFYTQLRLATNQPVFTSGVSSETVQIDSVVLALSYSNEQWGNNFPQEYQVYELDEQLFADTLYYSNRVLQVKENDLVQPESKIQRPGPGVNVVVGQDTLPPQLRIKLDPEIGTRIFNAVGTDDLSTQGFPAFFKGLYVTVADQFISPNNGGVHYFNLLSPVSKVTLYYRLYHRDGIDQGQYETREYDLVINTNAVYYTRSVHDFSTAMHELQAQLDGDFSSTGQKTFIRAAAGLKTRVFFPHLGSIRNDTLAINNAELIIPFQADNAFAPPNRLFAVGRNVEENTAFLLPDIFEGDSHFGGFLDVINSQYRVNVTRWATQVAFGSRENTAIELVPDRAGSSANRVIINGPQHPDRPMRLVIHYTKY